MNYNNSKTLYNMKKFMKLNAFGLALLMSLFTIQLSAQEGQRGQRQGGGPGGPGGPGRGFQMSEDDIKERVDNLGETLEFSKEQHKKILDYEMEFYNKMQVERQIYTGDNREEMRATMMKAREERDKKYEEVLTQEQLKKYKEIQEQRRSEMRRQYQDRNPGGQGGDRPARGRGRN